MAKFLILLTFILNSFFGYKGSFEKTTSFEYPASSKKIFTEAENRNNHLLTKDNFKNSNDESKPYLFNFDFLFDQKVVSKFTSKTVFNQNIALHKFYCIWII